MTANSPVNELEEHELCYACLGVNEPWVPFCRHCRSPLTAYAAIGPIEKAYALGVFARKGVKHPNLLVRWLVSLLVWTLLISILMGLMLP